MSAEPPVVTPQHRVCHSRRHARALIDARPDISATGAVYVRLDGVEVVTSPFVSELLAAWPHATPVGANEDVQTTWDMVRDGR